MKFVLMKLLTNKKRGKKKRNDTDLRYTLQLPSPR